jgi:hypothetical protein
MHLVVKPLDVLLTEATDACRELHRANQSRLFPAAKRVLVHSEPPRSLTHTEESHTGIVPASVEIVNFGSSGESAASGAHERAGRLKWPLLWPRRGGGGKVEGAKVDVVDLVEKMYCIDKVYMVEWSNKSTLKEVSAAPIERKRRPGPNRAADDPD